jgi:dolichyl-phosphate-mannose--protein O-mannosyl transferase
MNDTLPVDNAHVTQSRLILLDAALILFMSLSLLFYIKFHQMRYRYDLPFVYASRSQLKTRTSFCFSTGNLRPAGGLI